MPHTKNILKISKSIKKTHKIKKIHKNKKNPEIKKSTQLGNQNGNDMTCLHYYHPEIFRNRCGNEVHNVDIFCSQCGFYIEFNDDKIRERDHHKLFLPWILL